MDSHRHGHGGTYPWKMRQLISMLYFEKGTIQFYSDSDNNKGDDSQKGAGQCKLTTAVGRQVARRGAQSMD